MCLFERVASPLTWISFVQPLDKYLGVSILWAAPDIVTTRDTPPHYKDRRAPSGAKFTNEMMKSLSVANDWPRAPEPESFRLSVSVV